MRILFLIVGAVALQSVRAFGGYHYDRNSRNGELNERLQGFVERSSFKPSFDSKPQDSEYSFPQNNNHYLPPYLSPTQQTIPEINQKYLPPFSNHFPGTQQNENKFFSSSNQHHNHQSFPSFENHQQLPDKYLPPSGWQSSVGKTYLPPPSAIQATAQTPIVTKQFYYVSASEDENVGPKKKHFVLGRPTRNYRVVFIKAPQSDNANLKYTAEFAPQQEKTVIYVLSKKENDLQIEDISTPAPTQAPRPEIFFIKYKTKDEADLAQKEIQEQYDKLGGTSEFHNEGEAPVSSVVGVLDKGNTDNGYNYERPGKPNTNIINNYLVPPPGKNQL